jgi:hypothetical protein
MGTIICEFCASFHLIFSAWLGKKDLLHFVQHFEEKARDASENADSENPEDRVLLIAIEDAAREYDMVKIFQVENNISLVEWRKQRRKSRRTPRNKRFFIF